MAQRARIVLLAAEGLPNAEIARRVGMTRPTVIQWRSRYVAGGVDALGDLERSGQPSVIDDAAVVVATLTAPPDSLGVTHWSARLLAKHLGISFASVARIWREWRLQPWRRETFKFSTDPELDAKVRDIVGLYLHPPDRAVVVCVDEKTQVQALDRTAPILRLRPGLPEKATHDYLRHGTTSLFAAFQVATGKVTNACYDRHTNVEFLDFPQARRPDLPAGQAARRRRLLRHPQAPEPHGLARPQPSGRHALHPDLRIMAQPGRGVLRHHHPQAIRRGTFTRVKDLITAIETFIDGWNERCQPFIWTKTADDVLTKAHRKKTSNTRH